MSAAVLARPGPVTAVTRHPASPEPQRPPRAAQARPSWGRDQLPEDLLIMPAHHHCPAFYGSGWAPQICQMTKQNSRNDGKGHSKGVEDGEVDSVYKSSKIRCYFQSDAGKSRKYKHLNHSDTIHQNLYKQPYPLQCKITVTLIQWICTGVIESYLDTSP